MRRCVTVEEEGEEGLRGARRAGGTPGESKLAVQCSLDDNGLQKLCGMDKDVDAVMSLVTGLPTIQCRC